MWSHPPRLLVAVVHVTVRPPVRTARTVVRAVHVAPDQTPGSQKFETPGIGSPERPEPAICVETRNGTVTLPTHVADGGFVVRLGVQTMEAAPPPVSAKTLVLNVVTVQPMRPVTMIVSTVSTTSGEPASELTSTGMSTEASTTVSGIASRTSTPTSDEPESVPASVPASAAGR